jgi:DNA invertase Pin-like site-specific DNA recombinase
MANLVYTRVSTDEQSTQRQTHLLAAAGLTADADGVRIFSDPATSSKIPALERPGFIELAGYARPGDTLTVSELYRLCRDLADILAVRDWCQQHGVGLRVLSGALSGIVDLAATDATTTMLVNVLVSVGQFQRDLQNELTRDGLAAAWAAGSRSGRRPRIVQLGVLDDVREAFSTNGASIAALAREHQVSRVAIRTAVADLLPGRPPQEPAAAVTVAKPAQLRVEIPGKIATHLREQAHDELGEAERQALRRGREVRRGQGFSLHVTASPQVHRALLAAAAALGAEGASSADRKAYRIYCDRLANLPSGAEVESAAVVPEAASSVQSSSVTSGDVEHEPNHQDWQPLFDAAAHRDHEDLITRALELAAGVRAGDGRLVDELIVHMRVLEYRYKERGTGYPMWKANTPRLAEMPVRGTAAQCDDPAVRTMHMVTGKESPMFVATTAGFVRATFDTGRLQTMTMATLPGQLPPEDTAPVVLYGTLNSTVASLLSAVRDGADPAEVVTKLVDRIVHHRPFPWERGGWNE